MRKHYIFETMQINQTDKSILRIDQLTFTRFIAAIAIVIYHFGQQAIPFNSGNIKFLVTQANIGVSYFFVLSGFIMIIAYNRFPKIDAVDYLRNRFARIYPLIILSLLPFIGALLLFPGKVSLGAIVLNLTTLQAWIPGYATVGNYPLWSLTVEIFFYICFPFLLNKIYKKYPLKNIVISIIAIWAVTMVIQHVLLNSVSNNGAQAFSSDIIYYFPPMHLNQFLIGNLAGLFVVAKQVSSGRRYDVFVLLSAAVIFLFLKYPFGINYHDGFLAWFFASFIIFLSLNTGIITKIFNLKPLVFLGEISFAIYVLQFPVFEITSTLIEKLHITANANLIFYICLGLLIAVSAFCHIFVELPLRNRIKAIRLKPVV